MTVHWSENANGYLEYRASGSRDVIHVWREDLAAIVDVCQMFDEDTRARACNLLAQERYSYRNLINTLAALRRARDHVRQDQVDPDDYLDLLTAIDDLEGIVRRISTLT